MAHCPLHSAWLLTPPAACCLLAAVCAQELVGDVMLSTEAWLENVQEAGTHGGNKHDAPSMSISPEEWASAQVAEWQAAAAAAAEAGETVRAGPTPAAPCTAPLLLHCAALL